MPRKKHSFYSPWATFVLTLSMVALLFAAGWLPEQDGLRVVDLLSELKRKQSTSVGRTFDSKDLLARFDYGYQLQGAAKKIEEEPMRIEVEEESVAEPSVVVIDTTAVVDTVVAKPKRVVAVLDKELIPIEDFSPSGRVLSSFLAKLQTANHASRPVRIAVVGDSFIEGDIVTQDLRELLQDRFGGSGVGFVPITSQVAGFRQTVGMNFSGWSTASIVGKPSRGKYLLSSYLYTPSAERSRVSYTTSTSRRYLESFSRGCFLYTYKGKGSAKVEVQVNDDQAQMFTIYPSERLNQVVLVEDSIRSISYTVVGGGVDFVAYGAYLDQGSGVCVDNYSVRGNSGVSLALIDEGLMKELHTIQPIDMVVLQYGLNVAQADVKNYTLYQTQMEQAVKHLKSVMPDVAVLVLGVPDRTHRTNEGWVTMPGVVAMDKTQRALAESTGVLYWSTLDAMRARGGMSKFVDRGWAAKDYTHLSARGGREIGRALFDAMMYEYASLNF